MRLTAICFVLVICWVACAPAWAQDNAAEEAAHRAAVLAHLPADAAQRVFGRAKMPAPGEAEAIGAYERGCLDGAVQLPADGPNWQVMRPSRNRAWGMPALIAFIEQLAPQLPAKAGWPGLLIGDIGQPRGGPMLTGHGSHQIGLDADIWLTPMPARRLSLTERDNMSAIHVVASGSDDVNAAWAARDRRLLEAFARQPQVARIFVNPAIKRELCREAGADRVWLRKIRPWWGHTSHFHVRLTCPADQPECRDQPPPPPGDGCGKQLAWWFTPQARHPPPSHAGPLLLSDLPRSCAALVAAPSTPHSAIPHSATQH
ncbi:MAG: penicillin-insensitive murein endopeptidase [Stellaceae bacterium]